MIKGNYCTDNELEKKLLQEKRAFDEKIQKLEAEYASSLPDSKKEEFLFEVSTFRGKFEGNTSGLKAKGQSPF